MTLCGTRCSGRAFCSHVGGFFPNGIEPLDEFSAGANATVIERRADTISCGSGDAAVQRFAFSAGEPIDRFLEQRRNGG